MTCSLSHFGMGASQRSEEQEMAREDDVKVRGTIIQKMTAQSGFDQPTFLVDVPEQEGEHKSGSRHFVSAREVVGRTTAKMSASGVEPWEGDEVFLLVNPNPNRHVCAIIRLTRQVSARDARRSG
jgi:hypothetical protein